MTNKLQQRMLDAILTTAQAETARVITGNVSGNDDWTLGEFSQSELRVIYRFIEGFVDYENVIRIDRDDAPEWLRELADDRKINAIKAVRNTMNDGYVADQPMTKVTLGLKCVKDFVEEVGRAII